MEFSEFLMLSFVQKMKKFTLGVDFLEKLSLYANESSGLSYPSLQVVTIEPSQSRIAQHITSKISV